MKKQKQNKAITLIALIITVIVILILAGVSINMIAGGEGLFSKTQTSVDKYNKAEALEQMNIKVSEVQMKYYSEEHRKATLQEMANYLTADEYVEYVKLGAPTASIDVTGYSSILVKLKAYVYEFEIGENMQVAVVEEDSGGGSGTPITSVISDTNIGDYINLGTNLTDIATTGHKADWRIFDVDETGVYAILSDYLPNTSIPTTMKVSEAAGAKEVTLSKNANGWTIGWLASGDGAVADNTEAVGTLLTASNWDFLVSSTSLLRGKITGGPTYEQFAKSWNKANSAVATMDETTPTSYTGLTNTEGNTAGMYIITDTKSSTIYGNRLASPNTSNTSEVWEVDYFIGRVGCVSSDTVTILGIRPLVHLTSDINVNGQDANGVWQLAE